MVATHCFGITDKSFRDMLMTKVNCMPETGTAKNQSELFCFIILTSPFTIFFRKYLAGFCCIVLPYIENIGSANMNIA